MGPALDFSPQRMSLDLLNCYLFIVFLFVSLFFVSQLCVDLLGKHNEELST